MYLNKKQKIVIGHMAGMHQELVLSCITITLTKESSSKSIIFDDTFWGRAGQNFELIKERSERQTISLTSDMVMISTLELKRTTLLGQAQGLKSLLLTIIDSQYKVLFLGQKQPLTLKSLILNVVRVAVTSSVI